MGIISRVRDLYVTEKTYMYEIPRKEGDDLKIINEEGDVIAQIIPSQGLLYVYQNYSFDGCTPKFKICNHICGVSDGGVTDEGLPRLYHASLKHDVLCQFYKLDIPYSRKEIDKEFKKDLTRVKWEFINLYYKVVRLYAILRGYK